MIIVANRTICHLVLIHIIAISWEVRISAYQQNNIIGQCETWYMFGWPWMDVGERPVLFHLLNIIHLTCPTLAHKIQSWLNDCRLGSKLFGIFPGLQSNSFIFDRTLPLPSLDQANIFLLDIWCHWLLSCLMFCYRITFGEIVIILLLSKSGSAARDQTETFLISENYPKKT